MQVLIHKEIGLLVGKTMNYFNPVTSTKVSLVGVDSLWGDCTFIPADWGS